MCIIFKQNINQVNLKPTTITSVLTKAHKLIFAINTQLTLLKTTCSNNLKILSNLKKQTRKTYSCPFESCLYFPGNNWYVDTFAAASTYDFMLILQSILKPITLVEIVFNLNVLRKQCPTP